MAKEWILNSMDTQELRGIQLGDLTKDPENPPLGQIYSECRNVYTFLYL